MKKCISALPLFVFLVACGGGDNPGGSSEDSSGGTAVRGVTASEIRIGLHTDMSGPLASWGVGSVNGQRLRFDEVNDAGGIHGRKIRLYAEDTHYQVPVAVKAANKLINVDNIFLMVGALGTPPNIAVMPRQFQAGVPNLFPLTAAAQMYEPLHPMKFSYFVSYLDQVRAGMGHFVKQHEIHKVCLQVVASDYGVEVAGGFDQAVAEHQLDVVYTGRHKGTETDFVGSVTNIKNSGCELLFLGPLVKDAILVYTALRDAGWDGTVLSNMVPYTQEVAAANNGALEGLFSVNQLNLPDFDAEVEAGSWVGEWYTRYKQKFGQEPNVQAQLGYAFADLTVHALETAGAAPTVDKVLSAMESISNYADPFGGASVSFSETKHQGGDSINLHVVKDGKWVMVEKGIPY